MVRSRRFPKQRAQVRFLPGHPPIEGRLRLRRRQVRSSALFHPCSNAAQRPHGNERSFKCAADRSLAGHGLGRMVARASYDGEVEVAESAAPAVETKTDKSLALPHRVSALDVAREPRPVERGCSHPSARSA
jgi:hypothetical protein